MSTKLKALGLGLLAVMAMGAFGVMNASATGGGKFDVGAGGTKVVGTENGDHNLEIEMDSGGILDCTNATYNAATAAGEVESITVAPLWSECFTTDSPATKFEVHENGCTLQFTVGPSLQDNTVHVCQSGGPIVLTHQNCTITVEKQTVGDGTVWAGDPAHENVGPEGVTYNTITQNGKHAITLVSTAVLETKYHGGICQLLGTKHTAEIFGSLTVAAQSANGEPVDLTATVKP